MAKIVDVAGRAGVSPSTVSNVFNNPDRVRPSTRARVLAAADELGFQPNQLARSLRYGTSPLTAIVVSDARNPFVAQVVRSAQEALTETGRLPIVVSTDGDDSRVLESIEQLRSAGVRSFLFDPLPFKYRPETVDALRALSRTGLSFTFISNQMAHAGVDTITTGGREGTMQMIDHLVELGHSRIGFVSIAEAANLAVPGGRRLQGFLDGMANHGLKIRDGYVQSGPFESSTGTRALDAMWDLDTRPTAIVTVDDSIASGVLAACHRRGIRVPDDLSVCGYNDEPLARQVYPPLTTLALATVEAGRAAVEMLLERIDDGMDLPAPRTHHLEYELVIRESTGPRPDPDTE